MLSNRKNKNGGFSLMSTIIYIAIISSVMTGFVFFVLAVSDTRNKNYSIQEVQSNARVILNFVSQKIRSADDVITPSENSSSNTLELDMPAPEDNIIFSLNDGYLEVIEGVSSPEPISSNKVEVLNLNFTNLAKQNYKDNIKIDFDVRYRHGDSKAYEYRDSYSTSASIRR